eukprot:382413-Rhodomonas_salina.1
MPGNNCYDSNNAWRDRVPGYPGTGVLKTTLAFHFVFKYCRTPVGLIFDPGYPGTRMQTRYPGTQVTPGTRAGNCYGVVPGYLGRNCSAHGEMHQNLAKGAKSYYF